MNKLSPKKLSGSKWTAVVPVNKEKHFIVSELELNEEGTVESLSMEAVQSKCIFQIDWRELKDTNTWKQGWK